MESAGTQIVLRPPSALRRAKRFLRSIKAECLDLRLHPQMEQRPTPSPRKHSLRFEHKQRLSRSVRLSLSSILTKHVKQFDRNF